jgi:hypothetical protein
MPYKTTADSTSLNQDAQANTLLKNVFYRIVSDTDIAKHVGTTYLASWLTCCPRDLPLLK